MVYVAQSHYLHQNVVLSFWPLGANFSEIQIKIQTIFIQENKFQNVGHVVPPEMLISILTILGPDYSQEKLNDINFAENEENEINQLLDFELFSNKCFQIIRQ